MSNKNVKSIVESQNLIVNIIIHKIFKMFYQEEAVVEEEEEEEEDREIDLEKELN